MPVFYSENSTQFELTEPQLTRWRHRRRGPRESQKINTESSQIEYDIRTLYQQISDLRDKIYLGFQVVEYGGSVPAEIVWRDNPFDPIVEQSVEPEGLETLVAEINQLKLRIAASEDRSE